METLSQKSNSINVNFCTMLFVFHNENINTTHAEKVGRLYFSTSKSEQKRLKNTSN